MPTRTELDSAPAEVNCERAWSWSLGGLLIASCYSWGASYIDLMPAAIRTGVAKAKVILGTPGSDASMRITIAKGEASQSSMWLCKIAFLRPVK